MSARPSKTQRMRRVALIIAADTGAKSSDILDGLRRGAGRLSRRKLRQALAQLEKASAR